jgi:hypothetical protein
MVIPSTDTVGLPLIRRSKTRAGLVCTLSTSATAWPGRVTLSADSPETFCPAYVVLSRLSVNPSNRASREQLPPV